MSDYNDLLKTIKKTSMEAVDATKPFNIVYGSVISANPIKIKIDQKLTLGANQLVLARNVTDYEVEMTMNHSTEPISHTHTIKDTYTGGGSASLETHSHSYKGKKTFIVHNGLKVGEKVILMQLQGGQQYVVIDREAQG